MECPYDPIAIDLRGQFASEGEYGFHQNINFIVTFARSTRDGDRNGVCLRGYDLFWGKRTLYGGGCFHGDYSDDVWNGSDPLWCVG